MDTNAIGQAASLYQNTAKIATGGVSAGNEDKVSFASMIKSGVESVAKSQQKSEAASAAAVAGTADISQVVQAVTEAEVQLQTLIAVRDKVVSAYQDILRMPI